MFYFSPFESKGIIHYNKFNLFVHRILTQKKNYEKHLCATIDFLPILNWWEKCLCSSEWIDKDGGRRISNIMFYLASVMASFLLLRKKIDQPMRPVKYVTSRKTEITLLYPEKQTQVLYTHIFPKMYFFPVIWRNISTFNK